MNLKIPETGSEPEIRRRKNGILKIETVPSRQFSTVWLDTSSGNRMSSEAIPTSLQARCLWPTYTWLAGLFPTNIQANRGETPVMLIC